MRLPLLMSACHGCTHLSFSTSDLHLLLYVTNITTISVKILVLHLHCLSLQKIVTEGTHAIANLEYLKNTNKLLMH